MVNPADQNRNRGQAIYLVGQRNRSFFQRLDARAAAYAGTAQQSLTLLVRGVFADYVDVATSTLEIFEAQIGVSGIVIGTLQAGGRLAEINLAFTSALFRSFLF